MSTALVGLSLGFLLFIVSSGITLLFGVLRVINFAHGAYFALGAYLTFQCVYSFGSFWIAFPIALLAGALLGFVQEALTFRPIYRYPHVFQLLASVGVALVFMAGLRMIWGLDYKSVTIPPILADTLQIGSSQISYYRIFVIMLGMVLAGLMMWINSRTTFGIVVRAASSNDTMAQCLGIDVHRLRTIVMMIGTSLAALGGVIAAPLLSVHLEMGQLILIEGFLVVTLGGLGSIPGTLIAALAFGLSQAFGLLLFPSWAQFATYTLALAIFIIRPSGLFAIKERAA